MSNNVKTPEPQMASGSLWADQNMEATSVDKRQQQDKDQGGSVIKV